MGSNRQRPCGFERFPKRLREDDYTPLSEDFSVAPVEWRLAIGVLNSVHVEINGDVTRMDVGAMCIGNRREYIHFM